nr:hypothetical protein [Solirubrobacter soli]
MLGLLALLELVDRLTVAGRGREHLAADGDLGVPARELERSVDPKAFGALDEGLRGEEVRRGETLCVHRGPAVVASGDRSVGGLLEQRLAFGAVAQLVAELFTGAVFGAFTDVSDSFEPEREGGRLHEGSIGKWGPDLK